MTGRPRKHNDQDILEAWNRLHNLREVCRELKIPYGSVFRYTKRLGIQPGKGGTPRPRVHQLDLDKVRRLYWDEEMSTLDIGTLMNVSNEVVRRQMKRAGIPRRDLLSSRPRGAKNAQWKGGKRKSDCRLHRELAAAALGGPLPRGWIVHHFDEDRKNTNYWDLVLFRSQSEHCSFHQRQRVSQHEAGSRAAIPLVLESGGLWLPKLPFPRFGLDINPHVLWDKLSLVDRLQPACQQN